MTERASASRRCEVWFVPTAVLWNLLLVFAAYAICRFAFFAVNSDLLRPAVTNGSVADLMAGALLFDCSAIAYTNILWLALMLLPLHLKERPSYHRALRWLWIVVNGVALAMNLADAAYFPFTLRRTTTTVFSEFARENNLLSIVAAEALHRWYLVLLFVAMVWGMWRLYALPRLDWRTLNRRRYYVLMPICLAVAVGLSVAAMRGGFTTAVRPITVSNANQYVSRPTDAALVLNTPFSMIRTIGKNVFSNPHYFANEAELEAVYSPVHENVGPGLGLASGQAPRNVVVLIVESFGREYIGALNRDLDGGTYKGYTPFVDSLLMRSITFTHTYSNGRKSIDGMPSILSSIPMMVEPFFLTPAAMNHVGGLAATLGAEGYQTAFFHGAQNGSMGFQAFARSTGFGAYYGRDEFNADPHYRGDGDFDGTWAIWDEPFLQFYCDRMSEMRQPFMTAVFTASSHHPFAVPKEMEDSLEAGPLPIHRCIRYTDHALRRFFESASRQPWYRNTLFVLTSDHTNMSNHAEYQTDLGAFRAPIIFFDPSGELLPPTMTLTNGQPFIIDAVAQQIDIMPTVLGLLGYDKPYVAFGIDVFHTPAAETWAFSYLNGIYQLVRDGYVLQFDGKKATGLYALDDRLMTRNLVGDSALAARRESMQRFLQALIQQYMTRMATDRLTIASTE